ncbi:MAG: hypothetical protein DI598_04020 [Pseudopedobacter saltans]|uniref:PKD domain-containing protein n=1 Tax=Pseudopedobacter saltans TaxID=151895 RepID=A0A2W5FBU2_9SPHI|nr:MAG: hypothetical protein DI598_04020 [Pseudopedobacter saltans]
MQVSNMDVNGSCVGIGVTFTNTSTVSVNSLRWDFGDNYTTTNTNSIAHTYSISGSYTITLTNTQNQTTASKTITIYANPKASFTLSDSTACIGNNINFTSTSTQGSTPLKYYSWTFGDGNVLPQETSPSISHAYSSAGTFVPILTVRDENGCSGTSTTTKQVQINNSQLQSAFLANGTDFYSCTNSINLENTTNENSISNVSYVWNFGDNSSSNLKSPTSHTYATAGLYTISLQVNIGGTSGCSPSYSKQVYIGQPTISIDAPTSICTNTSYPISATSNIPGFIDNNSDLSWSSSNGLVFSNDSSSISANASGTATLFVSNKKGCKATSSQNININDIPSFNLNVTPNTGICVGVAVNGIVNATNGSSIQKYVWSPINSISDTTNLSSYQYTYNSSGQYNFSATAISINGCASTQYTTLNIGEDCIDNGLGSAYNPIFSFASLSCSDKYTIKIVNKNTSRQVSYWSVNGVQYPSADGQSAIITLTPATKGYIYSINTFYRDGTSDLGRKIVIIDEVAAFDIINNDNASLYCANNSFSFLTSSVNPGNISSFSWIVRDETQGTTIDSSNSANLSYSFPKAGNYSVSLSIADLRNPSCISQVKKDLVVNGITGDFTIEKGAFCIPNPKVTVQLQNVTTSSTLNKVTWSFGDGSVRPITNPKVTDTVQHQYQSNNSSYTPYTINAKLEDAAGCTMNITKDGIVKVYNPKIGFYKKDTVLCTSKTITINNTSDAYGANYTWNVGGQTQTTSGNNPFIGTFSNVANPSELDVALHLVDAGGCTKDTIVRGYIKYREPVASFVISNVEELYNCPPFTLNIENTSQNFDSIHWSINGTFNSIQKDSFYYTVLHPGPVAIDQSAVLDGCIANYSENYVVKGPVAKLLTKDTIGCTPYTTLLYVSDNTDIVSYQWDKGDGITYVTDNTSDSIRFTYEKGGTYYPSVTFVGVEGCSDKQEYPSPIIAMQSVDLKYKDNYLFCSNDSIIHLTAEAANVASFSWSQTPTTGYMSDVTGSSIGIIPVESTTYHVIAHSANDCPDETGDIFVKTATASVVSFSPNTITVPAGTVFPINPTITNENLGVEYYWTPDFRINNRYLKDPTIIADKDTVYYLNVKNNEGCVSSDSVRIYVLCNTSKLMMANAFTPNGDGKNDIFYVTGYGIKNVLHFVIFDRWGKKVFERNNISSNDISQGWDGHIGSQLAAPGTYIYLAEVECTEGNVIPLKGSVVLIR